MIHIARESRPLGKYPPEVVAEGLRSGRFLPTDLAWQDPMPDWVPLANFEGLPETEDPPPEEPQDENVVGSALLPGAGEPAWERCREVGMFRAFRDTLLGIYGNPQRVFSGLREQGGVLSAAGFLVLTATLSGWIALGYQVIFLKISPQAREELIKALPPEARHWLMPGMVVFALILPLMIALGGLISSAAFHAVLMLLARAPVRFERTVRVYCYAWGAASILQLLPMLGGYLYPAFGAYLTVLGLRCAQKVPAHVAILAVFVPLLICCGLAAMMPQVSNLLASAGAGGSAP